MRLPSSGISSCKVNKTNRREKKRKKKIDYFSLIEQTTRLAYLPQRNRNVAHSGHPSHNWQLAIVHCMSCPDRLFHAHIATFVLYRYAFHMVARHFSTCDNYVYEVLRHPIYAPLNVSYQVAPVVWCAQFSLHSIRCVLLWHRDQGYVPQFCRVPKCKMHTCPLDSGNVNRVVL